MSDITWWAAAKFVSHTSFTVLNVAYAGSVWLWRYATTPTPTPPRKAALDWTTDVALNLDAAARLRQQGVLCDAEYASLASSIMQRRTKLSPTTIASSAAALPAQNPPPQNSAPQNPPPQKAPSDPKTCPPPPYSQLAKTMTFAPPPPLPAVPASAPPLEG